MDGKNMEDIVIDVERELHWRMVFNRTRGIEMMMRKL